MSLNRGALSLQKNTKEEESRLALISDELKELETNVKIKIVHFAEESTKSKEYIATELAKLESKQTKVEADIKHLSGKEEEYTNLQRKLDDKEKELDNRQSDYAALDDKLTVLKGKLEDTTEELTIRENRIVSKELELREKKLIIEHEEKEDNQRILEAKKQLNKILVKKEKIESELITREQAVVSRERAADAKFEAAFSKEEAMKNRMDELSQLKNSIRQGMKNVESLDI